MSILQVSDSGPQHGGLGLLSGEVVRPQLRLNQHLVTACRRFNQRAAAMTGAACEIAHHISATPFFSLSMIYLYALCATKYFKERVQSSVELALRYKLD
jgi:hypothetical protein